MERRPTDPARARVEANLDALLASGPLGSALTELAALVEEYGARRIARLHFDAERDALEGGQRSAAVVRVLRDVAGSRTALLAHGVAASEAERIAVLARDQAHWLVLTGIRPGAGATPDTPAAALRALDSHHDLADWRLVLAPVAHLPWSPDTLRFAAVVRELGREDVAAEVIAIRELCQLLQEERDRRAVADRIRHHVESSGMTQRDFAAWVGTSGSRLSTYLSGKVTPSAAMVLRIQRAAAAAAHHQGDAAS